MMTDPFLSFTSQARVWIYQSDRLLRAEEITEAEHQLNAFCSSWDSHGQPVKASAKVLDQLFVVLMAELPEQEISGCAIDRSVHILQDIGRKFSIDFFNRLKLAVLKDTDWVLLDPPYEGLRTDMYFHNNTLNRKADWDKRVLPVAGHWPEKFISLNTSIL